MNIDGVSSQSSWPLGPGENAGDAAAVRRLRLAQAGEAQASNAAPPAATESIEISARARELSMARRAVDESPDIRADKVAAIKKQIEAGTYSVSAELLARKLLDGSNP